MITHVPLRSILLATNLSDIEWLFPFTCSTAVESGASVTLLHVITTMRGMTVDQGGFPYYGPEPAIAAAMEKLEALCAQARAAKIRCNAIVVEGAATDKILTISGQIHAELLVMGT